VPDRPSSQAPETRPSRLSDSVERSVLALLVYLDVAVLVTNNAWTSPASRWIGGCCDAEQTIWFLRWIPYAIQHATDPFITQQLNAPTGVNLMWNTAVPFISLLLTPVTLAFGPIFAYNVAIVGAITFSAWYAFIALSRYTRGLAAPLIGGAVYGLSPYLISHAANHLNLASAWAPPLFLLLLDEILLRKRRSPRLLGVALAVLAVAQLLTSEEILATSTLVAGILALVLLVSLRRNRARLAASARRLGVALVTSAITFFAVAGWPLAVQLFGTQRISARVADSTTFSTDLLNLVLPTKYQLFSPEAATQLADHFSGLFHEANAYVGLPLLLLLTWIVARRWGDLRIRIAGVFAATMFVLSLGPVLHIGAASTGWSLPWLPMTHLPLLENILPARLAVYMWLAIAAIVAVQLDRIRRLAVRQGAPRLVALGIAIALVAPAPLGSSTAEIPPFFYRWQQQGIASDEIVLFAPFFRNGAGADPMIWAAATGNEVRMAEAYAKVALPDGSVSIGPASTELTDIMERIQDDGEAVVARGAVRDQVAVDLKSTSIAHVIVGPMRHRQLMVAFFTDLFARPPLEVDGVELWRDVDVSAVGPAP
jgi:hypothetical protein